MVICGCGSEKVELFLMEQMFRIADGWRPTRMVCSECGCFAVVFTVGDLTGVEGFLMNGIYWSMNERARA